MRPAELNRQDSRLYDDIRIQRYKIPKHSTPEKRVRSEGLRAFYNYKRHMKAKQKQDYMFEISRWGF